MKQNDPRKLAWESLARVDEGRFSDAALDAALRTAPGLQDRDRALLTELLYGVLRQRGRLDFALGQVCNQPLRKLEPAVLRLLRLGAYQLLFLERVPARAAVHETVELAKRLKLERAGGFVNGVLRALDRKRTNLPWPDPAAAPLDYLQHVLSLPRWLAEVFVRELGEAEALALGKSLLQEAPFTVRVNHLQHTTADYLEVLHRAGYQAAATIYAPEGVRIQGGGPRRLPGDAQGAYQLQDQASMLVAHLLTPAPGQRLLDAFAAPGGKTTHLATLADNRAEILALDISAERLSLVEQGARRLGVRGVRCRLWDLSRKPEFVAEGSCDGILVDAPCSGLGTLRRNPESRWKRRPEDLAANGRRQLAILEQTAPLLRIGGSLLYAVCTFTRQETEAVAERFIARHPDFERCDLRPSMPLAWAELFDGQGALRTWPHRHDEMDAFFAAAFTRRR